MKPDAIVHRATACANCATAVNGNFCPACGQETTLHVPSAREFLHEFVGHYVALEGKLWKTLGLLLFRPGRLTCEYIAGRRARYVQPLRLYLTLSIIFFALLKYGPFHVVNNDWEGGRTRTELQSGAPAPAGAKAGAKTVPDAGAEDEDKAEPAATSARASRGKHALRSDFQSDLVSWNPKWNEKLGRFNAMSGEEKTHLLTSAFFGYVPYAMFCLMPLFALFLKLLYLGSGRRYGEHLLFALHTNAFAFLAIGLLMIAPAGWYIRPVLAAWLTFYMPTAMRRVYGGSRLLTTVRWVLLMFLHILSISAALVLALGAGVLA